MSKSRNNRRKPGIPFFGEIRKAFREVSSELIAEYMSANPSWKGDADQIIEGHIVQEDFLAVIVAKVIENNPNLSVIERELLVRNTNEWLTTKGSKKLFTEICKEVKSQSITKDQESTMENTNMNTENTAEEVVVETSFFSKAFDKAGDFLFNEHSRHAFVEGAANATVIVAGLALVGAGVAAVTGNIPVAAALAFGGAGFAADAIYSTVGYEQPQAQEGDEQPYTEDESYDLVHVALQVVGVLGIMLAIALFFMAPVVATVATAISAGAVALLNTVRGLFAASAVAAPAVVAAATSA